MAEVLFGPFWQYMIKKEKEKEKNYENLIYIISFSTNTKTKIFLHFRVFKLAWRDTGGAKLQDQNLEIAAFTCDV